jgi:enoyl-CoA hydratase
MDVKSLQVTLSPDGILQLTLNRPEALNALNESLMDALQDAVNTAKIDPSVKALLLHGEGQAFCAGADIKQLATLDGKQGYSFSKKGQAVFSSLENIGKPSLAALHGFALGGGCELAMAATLRLAADKTTLGQPEIKLGLIPGFGGSQRLSRLIGKGRALELCLTGRFIKAEEALAWGLVNEVTTEKRLLERARELLLSLVQLPSQALKSTLAVIHRGYDLTLPDALELEAAHFSICCTTPDKQEGIKAFLEKRKPQFCDS